MHIYNTLSRSNELFRCVDGKKVGLYACGPTVYFYAHIGNMRAYITVDTLRRALVHEGYAVRHVINITDVGHNVGDDDTGEDKIRMEARKEHRGIEEIIRFYTEKFFEEEALLNIQKPEVTCRASEHIGSMLDLIGRLDEKGYIYKAGNGMYFDTSKSKGYGRLAGSSFERMNKDLRAGARVERPEGLRNITDFTVWRFANQEERDMVWNSRFGKGFPGWHIECSAMSMEYLGETIDIHTGGTDHIPIHHTNEMAQSEAATGKRFVRYWVHSAFMTVDGRKMSKSLRNIHTVEGLVKMGYLPLAFRYMCLTVHYRNMMNFTFEGLERAQKSLKALYAFVSRISAIDGGGHPDTELVGKAEKLRGEFFESVGDDLDIPAAITKMHGLVNLAGRAKLSGAEAKRMLAIMLDFDSVLGLGFDLHMSSALPGEAKKLIWQREDARGRKDFKTSDEIRSRLRKDFKITLEDTEEGTVWYMSVD